MYKMKAKIGIQIMKRIPMLRRSGSLNAALTVKKRMGRIINHTIPHIIGLVRDLYDIGLWFIEILINMRYLMYKNITFI